MPYINKGLSAKIGPFIEDITGSIITINNQFNDNLLSLKATIEATQSGSGTPSPINKRPIMGVSEVNITQQVTDMPDRIYTIQLGGTYYGGVLDVTSGVARFDVGKKIADENSTWDIQSQYVYSGIFTDMKVTAAFNGLCNEMEVLNSVGNGILIGSNTRRIYIGKTFLNAHNITNIDEWKTFLANNPIEFTYPLATPFEVTLTPQQIDLAIRQNTIFADTGNLEAIYKTYTPT